MIDWDTCPASESLDAIQWVKRSQNWYTKYGKIRYHLERRQASRDRLVGSCDLDIGGLAYVEVDVNRSHLALSDAMYEIKERLEKMNG